MTHERESELDKLAGQAARWAANECYEVVENNINSSIANHALTQEEEDYVRETAWEFFRERI